MPSMWWCRYRLRIIADNLGEPEPLKMQLPRRLRKLPPQGETICERFTQYYTWAVVSHSCFLPDFETTGGTILSCTIIVRAASKWIETYHDHMPVILD